MSGQQLERFRWNWRMTSVVVLIVFCTGVLALALGSENPLIWPDWTIAVGAVVTIVGLAAYALGWLVRVTSWSYWSACSVSVAATAAMTDQQPPGPLPRMLALPVFLIGMNLLSAAAHVLDGPSHAHLKDPTSDGS